MNPSNSINPINDLTRGSISKTLLKFALPFLLANFLQAFYCIVDIFIIGKLGGGSNGVAAIGNGGQILQLLLSLMIGMTTASSVLVGTYVGAKNTRLVQKSIGVNISFFVLISLLTSAPAILLAPQILVWIHTPPEVIPDALTYVRICLMGFVFIMGYNVFAAILRGLGNSKTPLIFVAIACVLNIALDYLLIACWQWGVKGAAIATIFSQGLACLLALAYLARAKDIWPKKRDFLLKKTMLKEILRIGLPIAAMCVMLDLSFMFIYSVVNKFGLAASAGYSIVNRLNAFTMLPALSFSMAMSAITAQNLGAGDEPRAVRTLIPGIAYPWFCGLIFLIIMQIFPQDIIGYFLHPQTVLREDTIIAGALYIKSFSWEYVLVPLVFVSNGFFNGTGHTMFTMFNNVLCTFAIRVPATFLLGMAANATKYTIGFAAPLASFASVGVAALYFWKGNWHGKPRMLNISSEE
ncbi:MAG: MATE family efflux transporter [Bacteriovoracaceae bacterium]|nr:MATE family efflux transporter [Bacteriovoracaceae bacterium]